MTTAVHKKEGFWQWPSESGIYKQTCYFLVNYIDHEVFNNLHMFQNDTYPRL